MKSASSQTTSKQSDKDENKIQDGRKEDMATDCSSLLTKNRSSNAENLSCMSICLTAKFGKERIILSNLPPETKIGSVKNMLHERTRVLPKRQKLIGLTLKKKVTARGEAIRSVQKLSDESTLRELKVKNSQASLLKRKDDNCSANASKETLISLISHEFILMGTPEEEIFVDPSERMDLPVVIDDFDLDFSAGSTEWIRHKANEENLRKFTESTEIHVMNEPRKDYPLLVLDLDHTLLDFSSRMLQRAESHVVGDANAAKLKRPFMDEFLASAYQRYDLGMFGIEINHIYS